MRGIVAVLMFFLLAGSVSAYITIEHWGVAEDDLYDEFVSTDLGIDVKGMSHDNEVKVVFTVPELGVRESSGFYSTDELRHAYIQDTVWLPLDAEYGEYVVRMTITDSDGNKRIKHRFLEIDQP